MAKLQTKANGVQNLSLDRMGAGNMRPFIDSKGNPCVLVHRGGSRSKIENYEKRPTTNAALRYDEWRTLDDAVIAISRNRLVGIDDLRRKGLTFNLNNAMATTVLTWEKVSDAMEAVISIDPVRRSSGDVVDHTAVHTPIPVTHSDFSLSERLLQESRTRGNGLDTSNVEAATRKVMEKQEDMLFGTTSLLSYGSGTLYTYLNEPNVNEILYESAGVHWDETGADPSLVKDNVMSMKQASIDANHYGPWVLYIPTDYDTVMDDDYRSGTSSSSNQTIRERLLAINGIDDIVVADRLPSGVVVLVEMRKETVDLIDGMALQTVQWSTEGNFVNNYKVMTIAVPRIKSDYDGNSGIVVLTDTSFK